MSFSLLYCVSHLYFCGLSSNLPLARSLSSTVIRPLMLIGYTRLLLFSKQRFSNIAYPTFNTSAQILQALKSAALLGFCGQ
jgi:hypothetical protein